MDLASAVAQWVFSPGGCIWFGIELWSGGGGGGGGST